jgi:ABC-2 type transport system ATP-binding protein
MDHGRVLVLDTPDELKRLIPGGTTLDLRVRLPELVEALSTTSTPVPSSPSQLVHALSSLPGVLNVEELKRPGNERSDGDLHTLRLYTEQADSVTVGAIQAIAASGAELQNMRIAQPSLEDVFIHLTGRNLRS